MKCESCGTENVDSSKFCTVCGEPLTGPAASSQEESDSTGGELQYRIDGTTLPVVTIQLQPGQTVYSESGGMSWMSGNVQMDTHTGGGIGKMFKRAIAGESLFIVDFTARREPGTVAFASEFPGKIIPFHLAEGESIIVQKDAFMCAEKSVDVDIHFRRRFGAGLFGGEGFIMQRLTGPGTVFTEVDGEVVEMDLAPGQVLKVDTGHVAVLEPGVDFDVEVVAGFKNILLGGEGLFMTTLRGPGKVWLQTMPLMNLARKIGQFMPQAGGKGHSGGLNINVGDLLRG